MRFRAKLFLLLFALMAASVLVLAAACGGDDEDTPSGDDGSPAATETADDDETQEPSDDGDGNGDDGGDATDIPSPPGASKTFSGTFTGTDVPFGAFPGGSPLDPEEFQEVQYAVFETDDSVGSVVDFYKKEFKGWKEEFDFGGDAEGEAFKMIVWSRDGGKAGAWMMVTETEGTTEVVIMTGAQ